MPLLIPIRQVLGWFYDDLVSQIPANIRWELDTLYDLPPNERMDRTGRFINMVNRLNNGAQKTELLVNCCVLRFEEECFDEANRMINTAYNFYQDNQNTHRQAVTGIMSSMVLWQLRKHWDSAVHSRKALSYFIDRVNYKRSNNRHDIEQVNIITLDLLQEPSDTYHLLFMYSPSKLGATAQRVQTNLRNRLDCRDFDLNRDREIISRDMKCLIEIMDHDRSDKSDKGEALAYCGIARWIMEDRTAAAETLRKALDKYNPRDPEYPIIGWMSGVIKANICLDQNDDNPKEYKICNVMDGLEKCVFEIEELQLRSDRANQPDRTKWYTCLKTNMQMYLLALADRASNVTQTPTTNPG
jgi:hypothetical protein